MAPMCDVCTGLAIRNARYVGNPQNASKQEVSLSHSLSHTPSLVMFLRVTPMVTGAGPAVETVQSFLRPCRRGAAPRRAARAGTPVLCPQLRWYSGHTSVAVFNDRRRGFEVREQGSGGWDG